MTTRQLAVGQDSIGLSRRLAAIKLAIFNVTLDSSVE